jgi:DNA-3-methyladenine glycosylase II
MLRLTDDLSIAHAVNELIKIEPRFAVIAEEAGPLPLRYRAAGYEALAAIIVSQMVSRASADAIWARLEAALPAITPNALAASSVNELKDVGLSGAKITALKALAEACLGGLELEGTAYLPADEAIGLLTAVKGIGPWSAEVFLLFSAGHPDIFPAGDVALQSAAAWAFELKEKPDSKKLRVLAEDWMPLRSAAARLLWAFYGVRRGRTALPVA